MNKQSVSRNNRRFNFVDAIIIIVLLLVISLLTKLFIGNIPQISSVGDKIEYTVTVKDVPVDIASLFSHGQTVIDHESGKTIGSIGKIDITSSLYTEYDNTLAEFKSYVYPDLLDMKITVSASYKSDDIGFDVNSVKIITGKKLNFRTVTAYAEGTVTDIVKNEQSLTDMYAANKANAAKEVKSDE